MSGSLPAAAMALLGGALGTWLGRWLALRIGFTSRPNPLVKQHREPVPYLGGLGIFAGVCAGGLVVMPPDTAALLSGLLALFLLGLGDDARPLSPLPKLAWQLALATLTIFLLPPPALTGLPLPDAILAVLWIVTLVNAVNFVDVSDGYAGAVAAVAFAGLAVALDGGVLAIAAAAACCGFLPLNWPPARVFLGDAGSHAIGYLVAVLTLRSFDAAAPLAWIVTVLLVTAPFLFEITFCTAVRLRKGLPVLRGSPDHCALRVLEAGFGKAQTAMLGAAAAAIAAVAAVLYRHGPDALRGPIVVAVLLGAVLLWRWLLRHEVRPAAHRADG